MPEPGLVDLGLLCGFIGSLLLVVLAVSSDIDHHNKGKRNE